VNNTDSRDCSVAYKEDVFVIYNFHFIYWCQTIWISTPLF